MTDETKSTIEEGTTTTDQNSGFDVEKLKAEIQAQAKADAEAKYLNDKKAMEGRMEKLAEEKAKQMLEKAEMEKNATYDELLALRAEEVEAANERARNLETQLQKTKDEAIGEVQKYDEYISSELASRKNKLVEGGMSSEDLDGLLESLPTTIAKIKQIKMLEKTYSGKTFTTRIPEKMTGEVDKSGNDMRSLIEKRRAKLGQK